jgi:hypothetical protein
MGGEMYCDNDVRGTVRSQTFWATGYSIDGVVSGFKVKSLPVTGFEQLT